MSKDNNQNCKVEITGGLNWKGDVSVALALRMVGVAVGGEAATPAASLTQVDTGSTRMSGRTARDFLRQKNPGTDLERVACLAYFLTYSEKTPSFKTGDLMRVAVDAGRPFLKKSTAINDALKPAIGFLASAGKKGLKQLSPRGEGVVDNLPDQDAVRKFLAENPIRKRKSKVKPKQK